MFLYVVIEALVGIALGIILASQGRDASLSYRPLDKLGCFTNLILLIAYICASPLYLFIGMICAPAQEGMLGIVGWVVSIICGSAALFCCLGLGLSVRWRRRGMSRRSFAIQFMGVISIALTIALYMLFEGNLLKTLN